MLRLYNTALAAGLKPELYTHIIYTQKKYEKQKTKRIHTMQHKVLSGGRGWAKTYKKMDFEIV